CDIALVPEYRSKPPWGSLNSIAKRGRDWLRREFCDETLGYTLVVVAVADERPVFERGKVLGHESLTLCADSIPPRRGHPCAPNSNSIGFRYFARGAISILDFLRPQRALEFSHRQDPEQTGVVSRIGIYGTCGFHSGLMLANFTTRPHFLVSS